MKSESEVRKELELLLEDIQDWKGKYDRVDMRKEGSVTQRMIIGNTIIGLEGRQEALEWILEEE